MDHNFLNFIMFEEKHILSKKRSYHTPEHLERTLAAPMAGNRYGCSKCGMMRLVFRYDGFWK